MPQSLINFLQTVGKNCERADLFAIGLPTGQTLFLTSGGWDLTVPFGTAGWNGNENPSIGFQTTTFSSSLYGRWSRGAITSEASFQLNSNTMKLSCISKSGETYPGIPMGILEAALNGLFDGALLDVWTAYMPKGGYGNVSNGIETKFTGTITKLDEIGRVNVVFDCADPFYLLGPSTKIPTRLIQSTCPWSFGDSNCDVAGGAGNPRPFTALAGSTQWVLIPYQFVIDEAAGYWQQGVVTCLTGNNTGLSQSVKISTAPAIGVATTLTMMAPWLMPVQAGDTFQVRAGCDKSMSTCISKFDNLIHYGGAPFVPVPTTAL
jgi:uncharacterized phage protein (TIGR02218 family)